MKIVQNPNYLDRIDSFELNTTYVIDADFIKQENMAIHDSAIKKMDNVSVIIDRSGSQYLAKWREYYLMLAHFLGSNVQVMSSQMEGVVIHDSKDAESILLAEPNSGAEGFKFALDQCTNDVVIIIGDTCVNDALPTNHGKFVIFWDDDSIPTKWQEFKSRRLNWVNVQVDSATGSIAEQIRIIATSVFIQQLNLSN